MNWFLAMKFDEIQNSLQYSLNNLFLLFWFFCVLIEIFKYDNCIKFSKTFQCAMHRYIIVLHCSTLHRGAFCQFPFRYYGRNKSTGKETGKTHLCGIGFLWLSWVLNAGLSKRQVRIASDFSKRPGSLLFKIFQIFLAFLQHSTKYATVSDYFELEWCKILSTKP